MTDILQPAIDLAEKGFPVQKITANSWEKGKLGNSKITHVPFYSQLLQIMYKMALGKHCRTRRTC